MTSPIPSDITQAVEAAPAAPAEWAKPETIKADVIGATNAPPAPSDKEDEFSYFAVLVSPQGDIEVKQANSLSKLGAIVMLVPPGTTGKLFYGQAVGITKGPWRYLVHNGKTLPLFARPEVGKLDDSPLLGQLYAMQKSEEDPVYAALIKKLAEENAGK